MRPTHNARVEVAYGAWCRRTRGERMIPITSAQILHFAPNVRSNYRDALGQILGIDLVGTPDLVFSAASCLQVAARSGRLPAAMHWQMRTASAK